MNSDDESNIPNNNHQQQVLAKDDGADEEQEIVIKERRSSIQLIMNNPDLTNQQRRHSIQILMDGRRRDSFGSTFAEAAKNVAAEFTSLHAAGGGGGSNNSSVNYDSSNLLSDDDSMLAAKPSAFMKTAATDYVHDSSLLRNELTKLNNAMELNHSSHPQKLNPMVAFTVLGEPNGNPKEMEENRPQCNHYKRNCSIISPCCGMVFGCRLCHDECEAQEIPFLKIAQDDDENIKKKAKRDEASAVAVGSVARVEMESSASAEATTSRISNTPHFCQDSSFSSSLAVQREKEQVPSTNPTTGRHTKTRKSLVRRLSLNSVGESGETGDGVHHDIDRFAIKEIICRKCFSRQSSKTNTCISCNIQFGEYHCNICNLWMENENEPYHCDKCGICRIGGKHNFEHCDTCGMCIRKAEFRNHNCHAGTLMAQAKCPVCYEDLFSSRTACHELPCNHSLHWSCFLELSRIDLRCPICKKMMITIDDMEDVWKGLTKDIEDQPVPPDETRVVDVICNDCETREYNRRWHPLGVSCSHCKGYNTSFTVKMVGVEAHIFLDQIEEATNTTNSLEFEGGSTTE